MIESLCLYLLCLSAALLFYSGLQNYSLIRSTSCSCSTCCFGLGFQLQNLQDFIKISRALIKDIFLQRLELKDRWKSHYNEFRSRSVDGDETDLLYQYLNDDRFILDGDDVYLEVTALLSECYSVSRDEYRKSNLAAADDFEEKIKSLPSKIQEVLRQRKVAFGPLIADGSCERFPWLTN